MTVSSSVSVIIPTYNREDVIGRAIASARSQTFPIKEIIVVDDASTDGTSELILKNFSDVKLIRRHRRGGGSAARNDGIAAAQGTHLALLDSDDYFLPRKIEVQLAKMQEAGARFSTTALSTSDGRAMFTTPVSKRRLHRNNWLGGTTGLLAEASLLKDHPFDENLRAVQDWDLFLRLAAHEPFIHVEEPLYVYETLRPDRMTRQRRRRLVGHVQLYRKHFGQFSPIARATHLLSHGMLKAELRSSALASIAYKFAYRLASLMP